MPNLLRRFCYDTTLVVLLCMGANTAAFSGEVASANTAAKPELLLGIFPYLPPRELETMYAPVAAEFSRILGRQVTFATNSSYEKFLERLDQQAYDIVFVQPFYYVNISDKFGYQALAARDETLPAVIVVKADSPIKSVADLRGKIIGAPPETAAISHLLLSYLKTQGINPKADLKIDYSKSHAACLQNVLIGSIDACATAPPALRFFLAKMNVTLRTIAETQAIPNSLFAAHPRISTADQQKLRKSIISWANSESGRALLKGLQIEAFAAIDDRAYDGVRALDKSLRQP